MPTLCPLYGIVILSFVLATCLIFLLQEKEHKDQEWCRQTCKFDLVLKTIDH